MFTQTRRMKPSIIFLYITYKLEPSLNDLVAIGTDGDPAIENYYYYICMVRPSPARRYIHLK